MINHGGERANCAPSAVQMLIIGLLGLYCIIWLQHLPWGKSAATPTSSLDFIALLF